ncbi:DUF1697 domain-containing protein [Kaistia dalseonensis]|uniref:Uncharacterized protein (DUF1697 family) n=1 Tax=Kaistia dalseonensis TaxID=410840 RepID=A0ABU0H1K3_9HYPH|nr:DUF1697 domain-containing protein [Kaistia dalseonensis]MCX5493615.1 DUF1697 domain-containing protein [Kaistia dalseonensis]MDQ0436176.1 uncharacterized protein (DUF1697 family) [Kaistia dalseonensis]
MTTYVALLYSIILGGGRRVVMADLKAMAKTLGLGAPRTLVATGNLVFEAEATTERRIEDALEARFAQTFGRHVDIIVRSASDWHRLVEANPFPEASRTMPSQVIARVGRAPIRPDALTFLEPYATQGERIAIAGDDLWVHFPAQPSQSRLLGVLTPTRLGGVGTLRNWNTIRGLGALAGAQATAHPDVQN